MGIEPPVFRTAAVRSAPAAAPAIGPQTTVRSKSHPATARSTPVPAAARPRLRILGLSEVARDDALLGGILRGLGVSARETVFGSERAGSDGTLPTLAFGPGHGDRPALPGLAALRADPRAKRTAWRDTLRPLAGRMLKL